MKLSFPNPSRCFDEHGNRICFWGYDKAIEVSFYVPIDALTRLMPTMEKNEAGALKAFDSALDKIHNVAEKVYVHGDNAYVLAAEDF